MLDSGLNLATTLVGFVVSLGLIIFVCARVVCGRSESIDLRTVPYEFEMRSQMRATQNIMVFLLYFIFFFCITNSALIVVFQFYLHENSKLISLFFFFLFSLYVKFMSIVHYTKFKNIHVNPKPDVLSKINCSINPFQV